MGSGPEGVVVPTASGRQPLGHIPVEVSVPVVTNRMTLHLAAALYDDGVWNRHAETISALPRKATAAIHPRDASVIAVQDGDAVLIEDTYELPVVLDPRVAVGSISVPFNVTETKGLPATASVKVDPIRRTT